jgi:hypothetical protein
MEPVTPRTTDFRPARKGTTVWSVASSLFRFEFAAMASRRDQTTAQITFRTDNMTKFLQVLFH